MGRSAAISSAMKSKKAATAGRSAPVGVGKDAPAARQLGDKLEQAHELGLCIAEGDRHRHHSDAGPGDGDKAKHARNAGGDWRLRRHVLQPLGGAVGGHRAVGGAAPLARFTA